MDPITAALAAGTAAGVTDVAVQAVDPVLVGGAAEVAETT